MVFKVLSRSGAIAYSYKQNIPKTETISISDAYDSYPHFNDNLNFSRILFFLARTPRRNLLIWAGMNCFLPKI